MTLSMDEARAVLAAQPFSRLIGAELTACGSGTVELTIPLRDALRQQFGYVHGGVLAYAADNAIAFAGGTVLGAEVHTRGFSIDYLRTASGTELQARASVLSHTSRQAVCQACVIAIDEHGDETVCALAQGTVNSIDHR